ncbi:TetR/AcrR family transcriptional regulator [Actinoplanes solisilvae]|uniref:TetR/AcrR family transcriptional regulator n=1 Tax=Actinoplanes solisilvae TaxID=2486853 RepID=UPI0013E34D06|nr:TetR/AcrR family transcriptional regulator [Actinoplanes solisilvae]
MPTLSRPLTRKGEQTRERIVLGAAAEVLERGVEEVRLEDVMARTATSKSQLFHYFPGGREEILLAVVRHETSRALADQTPMLQQLDSWEGWQRWRDNLIDWYLKRGLRCPLLGLLGADATRRMPEAQAVMTAFMVDWQAALTDGLRRLRAGGAVPPGLDVEQAGAALLAGIQGGVLMMITTNRIDFLEAALDQAAVGLRA